MSRGSQSIKSRTTFTFAYVFNYKMKHVIATTLFGVKEGKKYFTKSCTMILLS